MARVMSFGGDGGGALQRWTPADWKEALQLKPEERPEFLIRPLPDAKAREIGWKHFGHKGEVREKKGELLRDVDQRKNFASRVDQAIFILVDTRNAEFEAATEDVAALASKALGREVNVGEWVSFDGKLNDDVKRAIFEQGVDGAVLLSWVLRKSAELCALRDADEADLGKT